MLNRKWNMKINYKSEKFIYIIIVVIALAIFMMYQIFLRSRIRDGKGFGKVSTYNQLISFAKCCQVTLYSAEGKNIESLPKDINTFNLWMDAYDKDWRTFVPDSHFDPNTSSPIDYWRTPIELQVKSANEFIFISAGKNRKFENGQGDDITYSFNPYELKEKDK